MGLTASGIFSEWCRQYTLKYHDSYQSITSQAHEKKKLKDAISNISPYVLMLAIPATIAKNRTTINNLLEEAENLFELIGEKQAKIQYLVEKYGGEEERKIFERMNILRSSWFPESDTLQKISDLEARLEEWCVSYDDV